MNRTVDPTAQEVAEVLRIMEESLTIREMPTRPYWAENVIGTGPNVSKKKRGWNWPLTGGVLLAIPWVGFLIWLCLR